MKIDVKKLVTIFLMLLSGCTSTMFIQFYNHSAFPITIHSSEEFFIESGGYAEVKFFTSSSYFILESKGERYKYTINLGDLSGDYYVLGTTHKLNLQVEPNLKVYAIKPALSELSSEEEFSMQPPGFPLLPEKMF